MIRARVMALALAAIAVLALGALAGCGGGGSGSTATGTADASATEASAPGESPTPEGSGAPGAYVGPANAACEELLTEARKLGREFVRSVAESPGHDLAAAETDGLIRPGVRVLERVAAQLRAVSARYPDPNLAVYVGLYEPLLALAHLRLAAAGNVAESRNLETQMESIGEEQRLAARQAGLGACRIDFLHALVSSWSNP